jgi:hypothetical protein
MRRIDPHTAKIANQLASPAIDILFLDQGPHTSHPLLHARLRASPERNEGVRSSPLGGPAARTRVGGIWVQAAG